MQISSRNGNYLNFGFLSEFFYPWTSHIGEVAREVNGLVNVGLRGGVSDTFSCFTPHSLIVIITIIMEYDSQIHIGT